MDHRILVLRGGAEAYRADGLNHPASLVEELGGGEAPPPAPRAR